MSELAKPDLRREGSEYFTPPSISPSSGSTPMALAEGESTVAEMEQSGSVAGVDPQSPPRGYEGSRGGGSREGSPTPVKTIPRRPSNASGSTPTRPPPRASISGSGSRIPIASGSSIPRRSPAPAPGDGGAVPAPRDRSVSANATGVSAQAGPSRIPRPVRRVSSAATTVSMSSSTVAAPGAEVPPNPRSTSPRKTPSPYPPSRIPVASPRYRPKQLGEGRSGTRASPAGTQLNYGSAPTMPVVDDRDSPFRAESVSVPMASASVAATAEEMRETASGSRRPSYILGTSASSDGSAIASEQARHRRTASSSSFGSPSRRPSGPRPPSHGHTPRASISSRSSLVLASEDGAESSRTGRASVSGTSFSAGEGDTEPDDADLFFSGRSRDAGGGDARNAGSSVVPTPLRLATPIDIAHGEGSGTGQGQGQQLHIDIPRRTSSVSPANDDASMLGTASAGASPHSLHTARPLISPRRSSRRPPSPKSPESSSSLYAAAGGGVFAPLPRRVSRSALDLTPPPERPPLDAKRRASKAVTLGAAMGGALPITQRRGAALPPSSQPTSPGESQPVSSTLTSPTITDSSLASTAGSRMTELGHDRYGNSDFMPGPNTSARPSRVGRRNSQISHGSMSTSDGPSPRSSPRIRAERDLPQGMTSPGRNRQNLSVDTSRPAPKPFIFPTPTQTPTSAVSPPMRTSSTVYPDASADSASRRSSYAAQPSPPIPSKNPLRHLSRPGSASSSRPAELGQHRRTVSGSAAASISGDSPRTRTPNAFLDSPMEVAEIEEASGGGLFNQDQYRAGRGPEQEGRLMAGSVDMEKRVSGEWGWGAKRQGRILRAGDAAAVGAAVDRATQQAQHASPTEMEPRANTSPAIDKSLPDTPSKIPAVPGFGPAPALARAVDPGTPDPTRLQPQTPSKSPSMPLLGHGSPPAGANANAKASRQLGLSPSSHTQQMRSGTNPIVSGNKLLPPPMLRSPTSPNIATIANPSPATGTTRPPSTQLSKRSHLIREIAMTERAYANDLALIRDAFMPASNKQANLRPPSLHSIPDSGTSASPGVDSSRSSMFTLGRRGSGSGSGSGHSTQTTLVSMLPTSPLPRSPYGNPDGSLGASAYFNSTASLSPSAQTLPSPRTPSNMAPPVGKPISTADIRTVFLNIDQLAAAAEDLAQEFERAIGGDESAANGAGVSPREGEVGSDRLGEVFVAHLARLRPLFTFYCARQSTASTRLVELQNDSSHATYLKDRWDQIKPHTHAWNLDSMLIKPVQRVTKYPLLFDDLLACTTPVHPDYFSIRAAAEGCRTMALEIDEAKRRKDVVAGVISKKPSSSGALGLGGIGGASKESAKTPNKKSGGGALKLFRNNKLGSGSQSTISLANLTSSSSVTLAPPLSTASTSTATLALPLTSANDSGLPVISRASFSEYRHLVDKIDEADQMVRRVGREVVQYTAAAKEVFVAQLTVVMTWERVIRLDMSPEGAGGTGDKRLRAFRGAVEALIEGCWVQFNTEIKDNIIPVLSKLLECSANPRKVIQKRDAKANDYTRVVQSRDKYRASDRALLDSAREFIALHTQLVEELPAFLEGYLRIFDLTILALSRAQAKYHAAVRDRLESYTRTWIKPPKSPPTHSPRRDTIDLNDESPGLPDTATINGIIKAWSDAWLPYAEAMDHFQITRPSRTMADRMASYSDRTGQLGHVRSRSGAGSPVSLSSASGTIPALKHSNSFSGTKQLSPASSLRRPGGGDGSRSRSTSLLSPAAAPETFTIRRTATNAASGSSANIDIPSARYQPVSDGSQRIGTSDSGRYNTSSSLGDDAISVDRLSFGLPRISPSHSETQFAGLGLGFTPRSSSTEIEPSAASSLRGQEYSHINGGGSGNVVDGLGLGMSDRRASGPNTPDRRVSASASASAGSVAVVPPTPPLGDSTTGSGTWQRRKSRPSMPPQIPDDDAGEGWRNERVLYQCAVVADFDPMLVGSRRYRKLRFLPVNTGDLIDVFYEVGRIDELPAFPYPEIGVENDGLLVARKEDGDIGLVICSFLEPIV